jgi:type III secretion protein N (ATPase)
MPAIDSMNVIGEGQRVGLFGEPGTGKSTFISALAKAASADVAVIAMVGERGREVTEFIEDALGPEGLAKSVVVVATSDRPAMERIKAPFIAAAIAEHFRDQGKRVLFLMDSLTRLARAQREIGLAAGEPPARRAFPPSVFAMMPKLIERAGVSANGGSITFIESMAGIPRGIGSTIGIRPRASGGGASAGLVAVTCSGPHRLSSRGRPRPSSTRPNRLSAAGAASGTPVGVTRVCDDRPAISPMTPSSATPSRKPTTSA